MISGLIFDHGFNSWLGSVKRMVLAELARKDDILVVCVCKRGRHRSVARGSWWSVVSWLVRSVVTWLVRAGGMAFVQTVSSVQ